MNGVPLVLDMTGQHCLCVGGGSVAARRAPILLGAGADLTIIAPELHPDLRVAVDKADIVHWAREFQSGDIYDSFLILAATGVQHVDQAVAAESLAANKLVCVASEPSRGNCQFMAEVRRGSLLIALQTGAAAPAVTSALRRRIERLLPEDLGLALDAMAEMRGDVQRQVADVDERTRRWRAVVDAGAIEMLLDGQVESGLDIARKFLLPTEQHRTMSGDRSEL